MSFFIEQDGEAVAPSRVSEQWAGVAHAVPVFWRGSQTGEESGETLDPNLSKRPINTAQLLEARVGIEPTNAAFAEPCLTTWLPRLRVASTIIENRSVASLLISAKWAETSRPRLAVSF